MLIGRDAEQRVLTRLAAGARVAEAGVLVLVGEPGQGKTALLEELATSVEGQRVLKAHGNESESDLAFGGLDQLLRPLLGLLGEIPAPQARALEVALALRQGERAARFAISAATLSLLSRAAEDEALLVIVDDAHALDRPSAEALVFACRRLLADPLAVVAASRPYGPVADSGLPRLDLTGLSAPDVARLLADRAGRLVSDELGRRVHSATAGNPLAVVELASTIDDLEQATPATPIAVPERVLASYARRTAELPAEVRRALLLACVAGDADDAAGTLARTGMDLATFGPAETAGLVVLVPGGVEFRHPLARASAYAVASPEQRRDAHLAVAAVTQDPERRAWHRAEAVVGLDAEVADEVAASAGRSLARGAQSVAASAYEKAAALTTDRELRARRLVAAGEAAARGGQGVHAVALLDRALSETGDRTLHARVDALRAAIEQRWGSLERSRELGRRALPVLAAEAPEDAVASAADLVITSLYLGDADLAARTADLLESRATRVPEPARLRTLLAGGVARVIAGQDGVAMIRTAIDGIAANGPGGQASEDEQRPNWLLGTLFLREESAATDIVVDQVLDRMREHSRIGSLARPLFQVARYAASADRWDRARSHYQEGIALAREAGQTTDLAMLLAGLSWLEARTGEAAACGEHAAEAFSLAERHQVHLGRLWATYALGDLALGQGLPDAALLHYNEVQAFLDRIGFRDVDISPGPEQVECLVRSGQRQEAQDLATAYGVRADTKGQPWARARAERAAALVATDPRAGLARALTLHPASPDRFETARTQLLLGEAERRARRRTAARKLLRSALETFDYLGATPWTDRAAAELRATGEHAHSRRDRSVDLLTPQERQVASLLAAGRTTKQAAAAMFLSPKTVEYHLRHVYTKLGINNRTDLAGRLGGAPHGEQRDD